MSGELGATLPVGQILMALVAGLVSVVWYNLNERIKTNSDALVERLAKLELDLRERLSNSANVTEGRLLDKLHNLEVSIERHDLQSRDVSAQVAKISMELQQVVVALAGQSNQFVTKSEYLRMREAREERLRIIESTVFSPQPRARPARRSPRTISDDHDHDT